MAASSSLPILPQAEQTSCQCNKTGEVSEVSEVSGVGNANLLVLSHGCAHTVKSCIKAAASMTFLVKFCRLLYETGFYTRQVFFMYVNTKTRLMCDLMGPKLRLLFEGGFYSSAAFIQDFTVCVFGYVR